MKAVRAVRSRHPYPPLIKKLRIFGCIYEWKLTKTKFKLIVRLLIH